MNKKSSQEVEVPADETHKALLAGFRAILLKANARYGHKIYYSKSMKRWELMISHPRISGHCYLYIEGDKLVIGMSKKTVLDLNDPKMDRAVAPAVHAVFNPPPGSYWRP